MQKHRRLIHREYAYPKPEIESVIGGRKVSQMGADEYLLAIADINKKLEIKPPSTNGRKYSNKVNKQ